MKNHIQKSSSLTLPRTYRVCLFFLLLSVEFAMQNSSGLLSSASKNIKETLHMNDKEFGMFGTANGLGRVIGSSIYLIIVNNFNRKFVFAFFVLIKSLLLICFKLTSIGYLLVITRLFIGIAHMPPSIYIPVWIDQFGIKKYKTLFMTLVQVVMPTGKVVGYLLHMVFGETQWQMGFVFEGCYLFMVGVVVAFTPAKYFASNIFVMKNENIIIANNNNKLHKQHVPQYSSSTTTLFNYTSTQQDKPTKHSNSNSNKTAKSTFIVDLIELINNFVFVNGIIIRAILFGVNTALHFWISDYMRTVLSIQDAKIIFISYTIIAVSGPIGGVLASSIVSTFLGGYEHKNSSYVLLVLHCITCAFGLFIPFMNMLYPFCIMATLYLVFSSAALPIVQGIIITSVDTKLKGTAFSIANLVTMLCTSGPAPVLYGIVNDKYKNVFQGMGMLFIMGCACVGILFIVILCVCRYWKMIRDEKVKKLMEKKKKEQVNDFATDIAGAVNDASLEMNASIDKSREEFGMSSSDDDYGNEMEDEGDVEMTTKD